MFFENSIYHTIVTFNLTKAFILVDLLILSKKYLFEEFIEVDSVVIVGDFGHRKLIMMNIQYGRIKFVCYLGFV